MTRRKAAGRGAGRELAAGLFARGVSRAEAARILGVTRSTTTRWHRLWARGGAEALLAARRTGRRPRLAPAHRAALGRALLRTPRAYGYDLERWSLAAVAALIERVAGVRYHRRHVGRVLAGMGWTVAPVGASADRAFLRRPFHDPDGNALALHVARSRGS